MKVQYPGMEADSIESDLSNLSAIVTAADCRREIREMENLKPFKQIVSSDPTLVADRFVVPNVYEELCTERILLTEYVSGGMIDKVVVLDQDERNRIGRDVL